MFFLKMSFPRKRESMTIHICFYLNQSKDIIVKLFHISRFPWIPASAGMTIRSNVNKEEWQKGVWMTEEECEWQRRGEVFVAFFSFISKLRRQFGVMSAVLLTFSWKIYSMKQKVIHFPKKWQFQSILLRSECVEKRQI